MEEEVVVVKEENIPRGKKQNTANCQPKESEQLNVSFMVLALFPHNSNKASYFILGIFA